MNFFGFGSGCPDIEIRLDGRERRRLAEIKTEDGKREMHPLYYDGETVSGEVYIAMRKTGSKLEHQGIRIELIGQVDLYYDRGTPHFFLSLYKDLARPGELLQTQQFRFEFIKAEKPYESYTGTNCRLRYFLRVSIMKRLTDIVKEMDLVVHSLSAYPDLNNSIKMEVGIEDCLHIEFEYNRSKYHLKDVIVGKIFFLLVRIKVKQMELAIIKRETAGSGPTVVNENETIAKYEIMDGAPTRGESIPIRVFLAGYELTPTFRDINRKFSVRYYLNLVLVDEEDRRYFKQQEIILWRKEDKPRKSFQASLQQQLRQMHNPNAQDIPHDDVAAGSSIPDERGSLESPLLHIDESKLKSKLVHQASGDSRGTKERRPRKSGCESSGVNSIAEDPTPGTSADAASSLLCVAGTKKTLSGDDSDDEAPLLTGDTCRADVHQGSESAVDVVATLDDVEKGDKDLNEKKDPIKHVKEE